jgi:hypothetical protein
MRRATAPAGTGNETWNPYFVAYAAAHGCTPAAMSARPRWSVDFMTWISRRWADWHARQGRTHVAAVVAVHETERAAFEAWLPLGAWLADRAEPARQGASDA